MDTHLPLAITLRVTATNGTALRKGIEAVHDEFLKTRIPKLGETFESEFWRAEITECVDRLPDPQKPS